MKNATLEHLNIVGQLFAAADHGVAPADLTAVKSASVTISEESADFSRKVATLAASIMIAGDGRGSAEHALFETLAKEANWTPAHQLPVDCFLSSLHYAGAGFTKEAEDKGVMAGAIDMLTSALGGAKAGYGDYVRSALGLGLIGGAATGAAHHVLDQDITPTKEDAPPLDAAIEAKAQERDYFRRVRAETVARLRRAKSKFKPSDVASATTYA